MKLNRFLGAIMLIAGTSIGAGMLALPIVTGPAGGLATGGITLFSWGYMCLTGLLVLEANLWFGGHTSYISMAKKTLGRWGAAATWFIFLLLLYSLMVAYTSSGSGFVVIFAGRLAHYGSAMVLASLGWVLLFGWIIFSGARTSDFVNRIMMIGMGLTYVILLVVIAPHFSIHHFDRVSATLALQAFPIVLASFGYHIVIPTVCYYLNHNAKRIRMAIIIGSLLPLIVYLIWEYLILSVLPLGGPYGVLAIQSTNQPSLALTAALSYITQNQWLGIVASAFAFFAIASSFIGVALGLFDLLTDGLRLKATKKHRFFAASLTFIPPIVFVVFFQKVFFQALTLAGIFVALLHGMLPAMMVWAGRYWRGHAKRGNYRVSGGRFMLLSVVFVAMIVVVIDIVLALGAA